MWAMRRWPAAIRYSTAICAACRLATSKTEKNAVAGDFVADERDRHTGSGDRVVLVAGEMAGEEDDAVDLAGANEPRVMRFLGDTALRIADDQAVARGGQGVLDGVEDRIEEGVAHARDEGEHDPRRASAEISCRDVRRVTGRRDGSHHLCARVARRPDQALASVRLTVAVDTPARRATSVMVAASPLRLTSRLVLVHPLDPCRRIVQASRCLCLRPSI